MSVGDVTPIVNDLQSQFLQKGYTKSELRSAIDKIYKEWHLRAIDFFGGTLPSDLGIDVIASDLLHEGIDDSLIRAIDTIRESYVGAKSAFFKRLHKKAHVDSCYKDLLLYILNHRERTHNYLKVADSTFTQNFCMGKTDVAIPSHGKVSSETQFTFGPAISSENDKGKKHFEILGRNTNLGSLVHLTDDQKVDRVVLIRSGKSDSLERQQEAVLFACLEQLASKDPKGLQLQPDGTYTFQHHITTHLDTSALKAATAPEDERRSVKAILKAVDAWPPEGYRILVEKEGRRVEIVLQKPLIAHQIFSKLVRGAYFKSKRVFTMGQESSDRLNFRENITLLLRYLPPNFPGLQKMVEKSREPLLSLFENDRFFKSKEYRRFQTDVATHLYPAKTLQERALFAVLFRQAPPEDIFSFTPAPKAKIEMHAADVAIFRNLLLDSFNISQGVQCKSGTDRTGISVALASAQAAFQKEFNKPFIPNMMSEKEQLVFKKYFREAVKLFAVSVTVETRGYPGIKWGGGVSFFGGKENSVPYKYLYLEEDIEKLKQYGIDDKTKADVVGLSYKDLEGGISQYKGKIRDTRALLGFTDRKVEKEAKALKKSISHAAVKAATKEATAYLKKELGVHAIDPKKPLFTKDMHLAVHIKSLHLEQQGREKALQAKVIELKENENRKTKDTLFLYMLDQVLHLWQRSQNEKIDK